MYYEKKQDTIKKGYQKQSGNSESNELEKYFSKSLKQER